MKKNSTDRDGKNHLQLPWNISHGCWQKRTPPASREGREVLPFFVAVYISREHYSFRSTGHVAMVRFKFQLTDVENECY